MDERIENALSAPRHGAESVSIVIVAHNNWPDLEIALESALNQSWKNCETVLIDNDSTDSTRSMVEARYSGRIKYVRQDNRMDAGGYNTWIAATDGEFIQLLDADDFLAPNKIEKQVLCFREHPEADIVFGDVRQVQASPGRPAWSDWDTQDDPDMLAAAIEQRFPVIHSALMRRAAATRVGPWDENIPGAHHDYFIRAAWAGCRFVYSPGAWCFQRRGRRSQMSAQSLLMLKRTEATLEKAFSYVTTEPHRTLVVERLARTKVSAAWALPELSTTERLQRLECVRSRAPGVPSGRSVFPAARRAENSGSTRHRTLPCPIPSTKADCSSPRRSVRDQGNTNAVAR